MPLSRYSKKVHSALSLAVGSSGGFGVDIMLRLRPSAPMSWRAGLSSTA